MYSRKNQKQYKTMKNHQKNSKKNISLKTKNRIKKKQLTNFVLEKSTPGNPLLLHDEPIYYKNKIVGETTSSNYSFCYNKNMVFGYIDSEIDLKKLNGSNFEVEVAKNKYVMSVQFNPLHDPENNFTKIQFFTI